MIVLRSCFCQEESVFRLFRPRQSIPEVILRRYRWCTFLSELLSCQSYVALKSTRQWKCLGFPSRVLDLESCHKIGLLGTFSGRVRGPPHGFGVEKLCSGSQKSISVTLPETLKTSRNFWKFCVFYGISIFPRHFRSRKSCRAMQWRMSQLGAKEGRNFLFRFFVHIACHTETHIVFPGTDTRVCVTHWLLRDARA